MSTFAEDLGSFVHELALSDVASDVLDRARDRLLDALSTAIASRNVATTRVVTAAADLLASGAGPCTVLPTGRSASADNAALVNGAAVHTILFEDINLSSSDHPGAVVVPAALCAAEAAAHYTGQPTDLGDLLLGVLVGYEVHLWLGVLAAGGVRAPGFRTAAVFGTVGAAAAVAKVLRMSREETISALVMGANTAFGVLEGFATERWSHIFRLVWRHAMV